MPAWESEPPSSNERGVLEFLGDSVEMLLIPAFLALVIILATGVPGKGQTLARGVLLLAPPLLAIVFTVIKWQLRGSKISLR